MLVPGQPLPGRPGNQEGNLQAMDFGQFFHDDGAVNAAEDGKQRRLGGEVFEILAA